MHQKQSHSESRANAVANVEKPLTKAEAYAGKSVELPMERFKALVVKLLSVRREELAKEKRKYEEAKEHSRRQQERNSQAKKLRPRSRADSLLP
jgi:hypothetical protein